MMPGLLCCELVSTRPDGRSNWPRFVPGCDCDQLHIISGRCGSASGNAPSVIRSSVAMNARAATTRPSIDFDLSSTLSPVTSNGSALAASKSRSD